MANFHCFRARFRGAVISFVVLLEAIFATGCTRKVYVPVEHTVRDTILTSKLRIDTVQMYDSIYLESRGDTVIKEMWHTRRYTKTRVDTVYKIRTDTLVKVVNEVPKAKSKSRTSLVAGSIKWGIRGVLLLAAFLLLWRMRKK